jgi:C-terminal processing protease CtpA/Prc
VDVWREVNRQFVDSEFGGLGKEGWKDQQKKAVKELSAGDMGDMEKTYKVSGDTTACAQQAPHKSPPSHPIPPSCPKPPQLQPQVIRTMLASLHDPYTRFLTPDQYAVLASVAKGGSAGVGVSLQVGPPQKP